MSKPLKPSRRPSINSPVVSSHAQHGNVNDLVARSRVGGAFQPPPSGTRQPIFGEWRAPDYHKLHNDLLEVHRAFAELPAATRSMFNNDPEQLLKFTDDPNNRSRALLMGLVVPNEVEAAALHRSRLKRQRVEQLDLEQEISKELARQQRVAQASQEPPPVSQ